MRRNTVKKTKLLPVLLLSILVIAIVVLTVGAMHVGDLGNGVEWEFNDETGELRIFGDGPILEEGFSYWSQSSPFYEHNTNPIGSIVTVVIEEGINAIGNGAFSGQQAIKSISIPDSVTSIGERALGDCYALESVTIPGSVETIGDYAFSNCMSLKSVDIQNGVKSIGEGAFAACLELEGVTIPGSVETIGNLVFAHCISLQTVAIDETNTHFSFDGDILYNKDKTVLISYTGAGQPSELTIPDGVEEISRGAIAFALALERIFIPGTVITIGENAFFGCPTLVDVVIGKDSRLSVIGDEAFSGCTMLNSINLPDGLLTIGERAFAGCESLESILIPGSVKTIGEEAFRECESLESLEIRYGVESIGDSAFIVCISLESIIIPGSVKTIGEYAFGWCESLKNVDIPDSVETIGEGAFWGCTALESAVLGTGITSIDSWVFADCPELLHVIAQAQGAFAIDDDAFLNSPNVMIWAPFDSGAIAEASRMSMRYAYIPTSDEMISSIGAIETVYKNVPFEFVPVTGVQDNYGLLFDLQGTLPAGLAFDDGRDPASGYIPGTIYGVPQTTDEFEFIISATPRGLEGVYSASAEFTLVIADPLDPVDGLDFEEEVYSSKDEYEITYDDDYEVDGHIGILNEDESRYEITGYRGEVEDQILYIGNAPFELFAGLWINGEKQRQSTDLSIRNGYDYYAEDGSTRVTIFAQTIQDLDNGEYIAVAAFRGDDGEPVIADESGYIWLTDFENMLDIVAQRFYVDLTVPGSDNPNNNGSNNYDYGDYDYGSYDPDVTTPGGQGIADQVRNDDGGDTTSGGTASGGTATPGPDGPPPSEEGGNNADYDDDGGNLILEPIEQPVSYEVILQGEIPLSEINPYDNLDAEIPEVSPRTFAPAAFDMAPPMHADEGSISAFPFFPVAAFVVATGAGASWLAFVLRKRCVFLRR